MKNLLRGYFYSNYWKRIFFSGRTLGTFLEFLGGAWLLLEIGFFFDLPWALKLKNISWCGLALLVIAAIIYTLFRCRPVMAVCECIANMDIKLEIRVDSIFNIDGACIIPTNSTFDTSFEGGLISKRSLQGQFTKSYYDDIRYLDDDISRSLGSITPIEQMNIKNRKSNKYNIGTTVKICRKQKTFYLLAISDLNGSGVAQSSYENIKKSLAEIWAYIAQNGENGALSVPVLGTGSARVNIQRSDVIKEIIRSFVAACSQRRFVDKLTICISPKDYHEHNIDLFELHEFLRYACKYTEIRPQHAGTGTAI